MVFVTRSRSDHKETPLGTRLRRLGDSERILRRIEDGTSPREEERRFLNA